MATKITIDEITEVVRERDTLRTHLALAVKALEEIAQFEYEQTPGGYTYPERVSRRALSQIKEAR